jgi:hypothetical protein
MQSKIPVVFALAAIPAGAACVGDGIGGYEPQCDFVAAEGTMFTDQVVLAADPAAGSVLFGWQQVDLVDHTGAAQRFGVGRADGTFVTGDAIAIGGGDGFVRATVATEGGTLVLLDSTWYVIDPSGAILHQDLDLEWGQEIRGVGVPGGFLVAYTVQPPASYDYDVELFAVGLDGTVRGLGSLGLTPGAFDIARVGDRVWVAYSSVDGGIRATRVDLSGAVVDSFDLAGSLSGLAGAGDRGALFATDGTMIALDANGPGASTLHSPVNAYIAIGVPGLGYLVDHTWIDLDGTEIGPIDYTSDRYIALAVVGDSVMVAWTTYPSTFVVGEMPSRLLASTIPFGAARSPAPIELSAAELTGRTVTGPCFPDDYPD